MCGYVSKCCFFNHSGELNGLAPPGKILRCNTRFQEISSPLLMCGAKLPHCVQL